MNEQTEQTPWVIRTDFSDDSKWQRICDLISEPQGEEGFLAYVQFVDDESRRDQEADDLVLSLPDSYQDMFCFVVDQECIVHPEHPILVIGFYPSWDEPDDKAFSRLPRETPLADIVSFRALPSQIQAIENNLSLANMDYEDFADSVDPDGIFRGFA